MNKVVLIVLAELYPHQITGVYGPFDNAAMAATVAWEQRFSEFLIQELKPLKPI